MNLADRITLARVGLAPLAVAAYLWLPWEHAWCFWVSGWICALAEFSDWADGQVARARKEVSDFGKLADPFCDVFYRIAMFCVLLLPAGGVGYAVLPADAAALGLPVYAVGTAGDGSAILGAGLAPWGAVLVMVLREVVAGALRAMAATKGLVLAARNSGKLKAWLQGMTIICIHAYPAFMGAQEWQLRFAWWACWICAIVSAGSMLEYLWVNRPVLRQLVVRVA